MSEHSIDEIAADPEAEHRILDDGIFPAGQYRIERVQLLNWGSYNGLHTMPVGRGGIAILGPTGRGKSTILDAMSAVIMPNPQEFNRAARDDTRQRSERTVYSYARGKTDEVKDADSDRTTTRFLRPLGQEFPSGAAITWRSDLGETITAVRLAWIGADTATQDEVTSATVYLLLHSAFDLTRLNEVRRDVSSASPLTKGSLGRLIDPLADLVTYSQPELRVRLCRELGIGGSDESQLKALSLLRRAQASKGVFSIDELFKQFVLTEPRALSRWETTLGTYREASALYDVFETTRRKLQVLADVPAHAEQYTAASAQAAGKRRLLGDGGTDSRVHVWLAEKVGSWVEDEVDRVLRAKKEQSVLRREATTAERTAHAAQQRALADIQDLGGDPTASLREQQRFAEQQLAQIDRERRRTEAALRRGGLEMPETEDALLALHAEAEEQRRAPESASGIDEEQRRDLAARIQAAKLALAAAAREADSFGRRRSNVPADAVERRERLAEAAAISPDHLPYAGELFELAEDAEDWTLAVERVLGEFATHLLVDERDFDAVRRAANELDLRGRLVLVRARSGERAHRDAVPGTVPELLRLDERSPFAGWLRDELIAERSVVLVESPEELENPLPTGAHGAVTRAGLRHIGPGRLLKDDRRRASWIGLDNGARLREIAAESARLEGELAQARAAWDETESVVLRARNRRDALERLSETEWEAIDRAPVVDRLRDIGDRLDRVGVEQPEFDELRTVAEEQDAARLQAVRRGAEIQKILDELDATHATLVDIEDAFGDALSAAEPLSDEERLLLAPLPFTAPRSVADVERSARDAAGLLRDQIDVHERQREQAEQLLLVAFERYLELDRSAGFDVSIDSLPAVLAIHRGLLDDDLPHAQADWLAKAGLSMADSLRALLTQIEEDGHTIRRGVRPISHALRGIEFRHGSTLDIDPRPVTNADLTEFTRTLRTHTQTSTSGGDRSAAEIERDFLALRRDLSRLEERSRIGEAWRRRVLDAREHYQFRAVETRPDGTQIVHEGVAGKSGGEGQELIAFVLGAALRYRLGDGSDAAPRYAPIVLDEGFVKADNEYTGRSLAALRGLGFQLIVGAPRDKVNAFEEHVDSVAYVSSDPGNPEFSRIYALTIDDAVAYERESIAAG